MSGKWFQMVLMGLTVLWLTACVASQATGSVGLQPAHDRLLLAGEIQVAEAHLKDFGFDPGPVDGIYTAETQAAVRTYQARYGFRYQAGSIGGLGRSCSQGWISRVSYAKSKVSRK